MKASQFFKVFIVLAYFISSLNGLSQTEIFASSFDKDKNKIVFNWSFNSNNYSFQQGQSYKIRYKGSIRLNEYDKDITSISQNGYFEVSKIVFGNIRKIEITSDQNGKLTKKYYEGKIEGNYEREGKQWLEDILPSIVRKTEIGAEYRVFSIYNRSGIRGLLDEIEEIDNYSGSLRNLYLTIMLDKITLNQQEISHVLHAMEDYHSEKVRGTLLREILRNYDLSIDNTIRLLETTSTLHTNMERAATLRILNTKLVQTPGIMDSYFDIIEDMDLNSSKGPVLRHLMQENKLETNTFIRLFESLESFSSNHVRGAILISAIQYMPMEEKIIHSFIEAIEEINPKYYVLKGEIMNALVEKQTGSPSTIIGNKAIILQLLKTAQNYNSNSQKALTLRKINSMMVDDYEVYQKYKECLNSIDQELARYHILLDLMEKHKLRKNGYLMVFNGAEKLVREDYMHAASAILRYALKDMPVDNDLINAYFESFEDMDQDCTVEELLYYINSNKKFAGNELVVLKSIDAIGMFDIEIKNSYLLEMLRPNVKTREQKIAYNYALKELESDYLKMKVALNNN